MSSATTRSNESFRSLFETMDQGVVYQNASGEITEANPAAERILGLTRDQIMGRSSLDPRWKCIREDGSDLPGDEHPAMLALRTGQPVLNHLIGVLQPTSGEMRWIMVSSVPEQVQGDNSQQVITTFTDITARKHAEEMLAKSEARFRTLFETMQEAFALHEVVFDDSGKPVDYRYLEVNPAFERLTGLSRGSVIGRRVREVLPQIEEYWLETFCRVAVTGEPAELENYVQELDRYYRAKAFSPKRNKFVVIFEEITEQKKTLLELERSEKQMRVLFEMSIDPCLIISDNAFVDCNQAAVDSLRAVSKEDVLNTPPWEISPPFQPDGRPSREKAMEVITMAEEVGYARFEWLHSRKDGTDLPVEVSLTRLEENGHLYVVWRDISERKRSESSIRESEERYRSLVNNVPLGISLIDCDFRIVMTNRTQAGMFGHPTEWFTGRHCYEVFEKRSGVCSHCPGSSCLNSGVSSECRTTGIRDDGSHFDVHLHTAPLLDDSGKPYGFIEVVEDISERLQAENALIESEERFKALSEAAFGGIIIHEKGLILECNQGLSDITGFSYEEHIGMNGLTLIAPESLDIVTANIRSGYDQAYEVTGVRKDGSRYPLAIRGKNVAYKGREARVIEFRDISVLKQSEHALKESEQRFRMLVENSIDVIFVLDENGIFQFVSPAWEKHFGYPPSEVVNQQFAPFVHPDDIQPCLEYMMKVISTGKAGTSPVYRVRHADGSWRHFVANGSAYDEPSGALRYLGIGRDISDQIRASEEKMKLEQQLLHAQKLESLGVLAGGIAHDFNNILVAIIGNADLALMRISPESPAVNNLQRIEQAASQAADLAKQMLAYSGKGKFVIENIDLNRLLEEMLHMLEVSISKKAVLRLNLHKPLPPVEADATQMRQIIMNLVINASEAIGDTSGVIAITTGCMDCDKGYLKDVWLDENISEGLYVYLEIADTGCGMDKDTLAKIFDPFFTTKFTGRGLGMAAVLGIVRGHKGAIKVYSEPRKGTTFKVLLPASGKPPEIFNGATHQDDWQGNGTVLLVDDEETVRAIGSEMLRELGFTVITANDGREALQAYRQTPDTRFVILDLTMPHMDGEQCFRELRQLNPDVKVVMSSGYNEQDVTQKFVGKGLAGFVQKPYRFAVLRDEIRRVTCE